jgi:hypothetical protein
LKTGSIGLFIGSLFGLIVSLILIIYIFAAKFLVVRKLENLFLSRTEKILSLRVEIVYLITFSFIKNIYSIPIINNLFYKILSNSIFNFNIDFSPKLEQHLNFFGISQLSDHRFLIFSLLIILFSILFFIFICKWSLKSSILITLLFFIITKILTGAVFSLYILIFDYILYPIHNLLIGKFIFLKYNVLFINLKYFISGIVLIPRFAFGSFFLRGLFWLLYP